MPLDPVQQVLQRKAYRVRKAHPSDRPAEGRALLKLLLRHLESKCERAMAAGERRPGT
ncbi:hypothetical protein JW897_12205 [Chromobacterium alkanivorans]|nr:hypothetical protein [Chromobacterium alkanivorans]